MDDVIGIARDRRDMLIEQLQTLDAFIAVGQSILRSVDSGATEILEPAMTGVGPDPGVVGLCGPNVVRFERRVR